MVAAEVGERGRGQAQAVDPVLVEAVAGGLDRQMLDAVRGEVGGDPVQRDRVRRGQAAVAGRVRGLQAQRAEAGRAQPEPGPELAGEHGHRALAAGAGDGDHGGRLAAVEARRDPRQRRARLVRHQGGQVGGGDRFAVAQHRDGTGALCRGHELPAVRARARHRREQVARPHAARSRGSGRRSRPRRCRAGGHGHRTALPSARLASRRGVVTFSGWSLASRARYACATSSPLGGTPSRGPIRSTMAATTGAAVQPP